jgi:hypothetical protein
MMKVGRRLPGWFMIGLVTSVALFCPLPALAGGVNHEPLGAEAFLAGVLPPPGIYLKEYLSYYTADKLKNDSGRTSSLAKDGAELDKLEVFASATRGLYISPLKILGGFLGAQMASISPFRPVHGIGDIWLISGQMFGAFHLFLQPPFFYLGTPLSPGG